MDIQMPVLDGVSATRRLRAAGYGGPIVALTANVMQDDVAMYRRCGCNDVLAKPIDRACFCSVLQTHVGAHETLSDECAGDGYVAELARLTSGFVAGLPATFESIHASVRAADWSRLKDLLHSLKDTAGSYGFMQVTAMASQVEAQLDTGRIEGIPALCADLARRSLLAASAISVTPAA